MTKRTLITIILFLAALAVGQTAWAQQQPTNPVNVAFLGRWSSNPQGGLYYIRSNIGTQEFNSGQVNSQEQTIPSTAISIGNDTYPLTVTVSDGKILLTESSSDTDVTVNSDNFTLTFTSSAKYIIAASVTRNDGTAVSGCTISGTYTKSVSISIPKNTVFGKVALTMSLHTPMNLCTIGDIANDYVDDGVNQPEPTVTLDGQTLTKGDDYTVSYDVNVNDNGLGYGTVTVTGIGEYTGSNSKNYNIRYPVLSDFTQLSDGAYEIATQRDLLNLARLVNNSNYGNYNCSGVTFRQTADISYSHIRDWDSAFGANEENNFTPIGCVGRSFRGTYDGGGYTVSGIRIYKFTSGDDATSLGLFGFVGEGGMVKNVILSDARIRGFKTIGGLVGYLDDKAYVMDCYISHTLLFYSHSPYGIIAGDAGSATVTRVHYRDCITTTLNINNAKSNIYSVTACTGIVLPARTGGTILGSSGITLYDDGASIDGTEYYNQDVNVTISQASGYQFEFVACNGDLATNNGNGTWSFIMPGADVTLSIPKSSIALTAQPATLAGQTRYWATFYNQSLNYRLSAGAQAFTMKDDHVLYRVGDGSIIPAGCAVVIMADKADITLTATNVTATPEAGNILKGYYTGVMPKSYDYVLGKDADGNVGFFPTNQIIPAGKAYIVEE